MLFRPQKNQVDLWIWFSNHSSSPLKERIIINTANLYNHRLAFRGRWIPNLYGSHYMHTTLEETNQPIRPHVPTNDEGRWSQTQHPTMAISPDVHMSYTQEVMITNIASPSHAQSITKPSTTKRKTLGCLEDFQNKQYKRTKNKRKKEL